MATRESLYDSIYQLREGDRKTIQRLMIAGYFNQQETKRDSINIEQYIRDSLKNHKNVKSYIYIKESTGIAHINNYLIGFQENLNKKSSLINMIRIVHQSYQNTQPYFKGTDCDNNPQSGPILVETQKTQEQIQDRSFEIYDLFIEGAKKRSENASHKIGNMILLSNDDMAILISNRFMSLSEYIQVYTGEINVDREQQFNYPLPPSFFHVMEYLQVEDYQKFNVA